MQDQVFTTSNNKTLTIVGGGFPINFDHTGESVGSQQIQLTRALAFIAVVQAMATTPKAPPGLYKLHACLQQIVASYFFQEHDPALIEQWYDRGTREIFDNIKNIEQNSEGISPKKCAPGNRYKIFDARNRDKTLDASGPPDGTKGEEDEIRSNRSVSCHPMIS